VKASEILLLGSEIPADQALHLGLVNGIVAEAILLDHAKFQAEALARKPPQALAAARKLIRGNLDHLLSHLERETEAFARALKGAEAQEKLRAFDAGRSRT
jgi:enoyl-CoA hydratase/carnithine racemase